MKTLASRSMYLTLIIDFVMAISLFGIKIKVTVFFKKILLAFSLNAGFKKYFFLIVM